MENGDRKLVVFYPTKKGEFDRESRSEGKTKRKSNLVSSGSVVAMGRRQEGGVSAIITTTAGSEGGIVALLAYARN